MPAGAIDALLSEVNRTISDRDDFHLDDWERAVWEYGFRANAGPLGALIGDLTADIIEVRNALDRKPSESAQASMMRVLASLTHILACELTHIQAAREARRAHRTARQAADASGDRDLRVSVRAGEAWNAFSLGYHPEIVLKLADDAARIAEGVPSAGLANAYAIRAYVLASRAASQDGDPEAERSTLRDLHVVFDRLPSDTTGDQLSIWGFSEQALAFSQAQVRTFLNDKREAARAMDHALALYPPELVHGLANLRLIHAYGLIQDRDVTEGMNLAVTATQGPPMPPARRRIVGQILDALPESAQDSPAAKELRSLTSV